MSQPKPKFCKKSRENQEQLTTVAQPLATTNLTAQNLETKNFSKSKFFNIQDKAEIAHTSTEKIQKKNTKLIANTIFSGVCLSLGFYSFQLAKLILRGKSHESKFLKQRSGNLNTKLS